jgi:predicted negative regulator of RcsB-dependent stress response
MLEEMELDADVLQKVHMIRVQCLVNIGRLASGLKELDKYIAEAKDEKRKNAYQDQKIRILVLNDRNEEALKVVNEMLKNPGLDASYAMNLKIQKAGLLEKTGKKKAALALYEQLLKKETDTSSIKFLKMKIDGLKKKPAIEKKVVK